MNFLCYTLANDYIENGYKNTRGDVEFLTAISAALGEMGIVDPFHNKHINFVAEQLGSTYRYVSVPSKYYVFDTFGKDDDERRNFGKCPEDSPMHYVVDKELLEDDDYKSAECVMYVSGYYSTYRSLQVIRELSKHQSLLLRRIHIANPRLDGSDAAEKEDCELTELFFETFQMWEAISVHFENTILPYHVYKDIARKLCDCQQLEQLVISKNDFSFFNQRLDKVIRRLTSLKQFSLSEHPMSAHQCEMLMESLHQLPSWRNLICVKSP